MNGIYIRYICIYKRKKTERNTQRFLPRDGSDPIPTQIQPDKDEKIKRKKKILALEVTDRKHQDNLTTFE